MPHFFVGRVLLASVLLGILGVGSTFILKAPTVDMHFEPKSGVYTPGETFTVKINVTATEPVNVFAGDMLFDPERLAIIGIDYNTSIADLWAEKPWYSNGEGTLNFAGGTTKPGGFMGEGTLITVTFEAKTVGDARIAMKEVRVMEHNGLGTGAPVSPSIDAIFTIDEAILSQETKLSKSIIGPEITVVKEKPKTDLNDDGKQSLKEVSIFMQHLITKNLRSDFNQDGKVNTVDLSIILDAK